MDRLKLSVSDGSAKPTLKASGEYVGSAFSPTVTVAEVEGGHEIRTLHKESSGFVSQSFTVPDYAGEETARADAEEEREQSEAARKLSEAARAEAEAARVEESGKAVESAQEAARNANDAATEVRAARDAGEFDAGFGEPTATVGATVGTPSVEVSASGPSTAKVFHFEFANLKGEKGDTGDPAAEGSITSRELADGSVTLEKLGGWAISPVTASDIDGLFEQEA